MHPCLYVGITLAVFSYSPSGLRRPQDLWRRNNLICNFLDNRIIRTSKFNLSYSVKDDQMIQDMLPTFFLSLKFCSLSVSCVWVLSVTYWCFQSLCQWILSVKKNYRKNVAYHNWRHAFNTSQCMFAILKSGRLQVSAAN